MRLATFASMDQVVLCLKHAFRAIKVPMDSAHLEVTVRLAFKSHFHVLKARFGRTMVACLQQIVDRVNRDTSARMG